MILAAGLLGLLVTYQAHREITVATSRGALAITEVGDAYAALTQANTAVVPSFQAGDVALGGLGAGYLNDITEASQDLVLVAENNVAGLKGASTIRFAEELLVTYTEQIRQASVDAAADGSGDLASTAIDPLTREALADAAELLNQGGSVLLGLLATEQKAVDTDLGSRWLGPGDVWWLMLAPLLAMLSLAACTSYALRRGFRRILSLRLIAALVLASGLVVLVAALNVHDGGRATAFVDGALTSKTLQTLMGAAHSDISGQTKLRGLVAGECSPATAGCTAAVMRPFKNVIANDQKVIAQGQRAEKGKPPSSTVPAVSAGAETSLSYSPGTLAAGLMLAGCAGILAYAAYRPRLEEYRYRP